MDYDREFLAAQERHEISAGSCGGAWKRPADADHSGPGIDEPAYSEGQTGDSTPAAFAGNSGAMILPPSVIPRAMGSQAER